MNDPANREALKQEVEARYGKMKAGIPGAIFNRLPWDSKFIVRWSEAKSLVEAHLPRSYYHACLEVARRLEDTTIWMPGPDVVTRTKARQG